MPYYVKAVEIALLADGYVFATVHSGPKILRCRIKVPSSGEKNTSFGIYRNDCCGLEIVISAGSEFPSCPKHPQRLTEWIQIEVDIAEVIVKKKPESAA